MATGETIADLIGELRATWSDPDGPAYHAAGHRLAAALAGCGPVIHGRHIYRNNSHPDGRWCVEIQCISGDDPDEMTLCRRHHLPVARMVAVAASAQATTTD